jgi:ABC-2 type transport system permease protein
MSAIRTMLRKQLGESRWFLGLGSAALFGLGWLSSFIACRIERQFLKVSGSDAERFEQFTRAMGGAAMDFSSLSFQVMFWNHAFVMIVVCVWAIARGSAAVAGEIERGTLDITLSRPVSRPEYLGSQIMGALFGLALLAAALVAGNRIGGLYNPVKDTPPLLSLVKPAANLALVGAAIYGCALLFAVRDVVRWRPNLIAGAATIASLAAGAVSGFPTLSDWEWVGRLSVFKTFDPVEVAVTGETFVPHAAGLGAVSATGILLSFSLFQIRDLPSNS